MTEEERKNEVCELWRQQGPEVWQAETGPLNFCFWLMEHRPELLPKGVGDPCQLLRAELAACTDT